MIIAERLRALVEGLELTSPRASILEGITISLGLVTVGQGQKRINPQTLVDKADKVLYVAKKQGKNRVVHLDSPTLSMAQ